MNRKSQTGFTLIELVAVIAIFSVIAVIALQALTAGLRQREVLERTDTETAALVRSLALLRRDLESAVPIPFQPPHGGTEPAFDAGLDNSFLALTIGGQPRLPGAAESGIARVVWRHDPESEQLTRQFWPFLEPRDIESAAAAVVMLSGVQRIEIFEPSRSTGEFPILTEIPALVDVRLVSGRFGALRVVVAR